MMSTIGRALFIFTTLTVFTFSSVSAQPEGRQVSLLHNPAKPNELPFPGASLSLSVALVNTKDSQLILRGYLVRDGRLLETTLSDVSQDQNERLVFSTNIPAPLGELSYYFVLLGPKGVVTTSKKYSIRRECLPDISPIDISLPEDIEMKEKLVELQKNASGLQDEVQNYENVKKILEELKSLTES